MLERGGDRRRPPGVGSRAAARREPQEHRAFAGLAIGPDSRRVGMRRACRPAVPASLSPDPTRDNTRSSPAGVTKVKPASGSTRTLPSRLSRPAASTGGHHAPTPRSPDAERGHDQIDKEAVHLQLVGELRMRAPVVATLPAELLPLEPEHRSDQQRARLIEQPVRLRLPRAKRSRSGRTDRRSGCDTGTAAGPGPVQRFRIWWFSLLVGVREAGSSRRPARSDADI